MRYRLTSPTRKSLLELPSSLNKFEHEMFRLLPILLQEPDVFVEVREAPYRYRDADGKHDVSRPSIFEEGGDQALRALDEDPSPGLPIENEVYTHIELANEVNPRDFFTMTFEDKAPDGTPLFFHPSSAQSLPPPVQPIETDEENEEDNLPPLGFKAPWYQRLWLALLTFFGFAKRTKELPPPEEPSQEVPPVTLSRKTARSPSEDRNVRLPTVCYALPNKLWKETPVEVIEALLGDPPMYPKRHSTWERSRWTYLVRQVLHQENPTRFPKPKPVMEVLQGHGHVLPDVESYPYDDRDIPAPPVRDVVRGMPIVRELPSEGQLFSAGIMRDVPNPPEVPFFDREEYERNARNMDAELHRAMEDHSAEEAQAILKDRPPVRARIPLSPEDQEAMDRANAERKAERDALLAAMKTKGGPLTKKEAHDISFNLASTANPHKPDTK